MNFKPDGAWTAQPSREVGSVRTPSGVAHVFNRMEIGGAELRTVEVVSKSGYAFDFIAVSGEAGRLDAGLRAEGHLVHLMPLKIKMLSRYVSLMRSRKYRVVHSHLGLASGAIVLLAWLAGVRTRIVHFRSDSVGGRASAIKSLYLAVSRVLIAALATDIVGVSPSSLERGWRSNWRRDSRCRVIPNGFDAKRLREQSDLAASAKPPEGAVTTIVNVGRPDPVKNRGRALRVWQEFAATHNSQVIFVGEVNDEDKHAIALAAEQHPGRVFVMGDSDRVAAEIGQADVLITTSFLEGLPGVVLESLAIGVPVVSSDVPGSVWIGSQLPGIEVCSLKAPDREWSAAIERVSKNHRDVIRAAFDKSPFTLDNAVGSFLRLWGLPE